MAIMYDWQGQRLTFKQLCGHAQYKRVRMGKRHPVYEIFMSPPMATEVHSFKVKEHPFHTGAAYSLPDLTDNETYNYVYRAKIMRKIGTSYKGRVEFSLICREWMRDGTSMDDRLAGMKDYLLQL